MKWTFSSPHVGTDVRVGEGVGVAEKPGVGIVVGPTEAVGDSLAQLADDRMRPTTIRRNASFFICGNRNGNV